MRPPPERLRLARSMRRVSSLAVVAEAVAEATRTDREIYVERWASGWRWSLAHRGGAYPLLRIVARFLQIPHDALMLSFDTTTDGYAYFRPPPRNPARPRGWTVLRFDRPATAEEVRARIARATFRTGRLE
jgi:hypothetical protein